MTAYLVSHSNVASDKVYATIQETKDLLASNCFKT